MSDFRLIQVAEVAFAENLESASLEAEVLHARRFQQELSNELMNSKNELRNIGAARTLNFFNNE